MIGAVMVPGAKAPKPITRKMFRLILRHSVFVKPPNLQKDTYAPLLSEAKFTSLLK